MRISRTVASITAAAALVAGALFSASSASAAPPPPSSMAALGDSISQAAMTCSTLTACPANSWSTGTNTTVNSQYLRLKAKYNIAITAFNDSVSGATSADLLGQANAAAAQGAQYVTIEMGANDACTSTVAGMTPTATYQARIHQALAALAGSTVRPQVFVASVPSLLRMYNLNRNNWGARFWWSILGICQSMLANPGSTSPADTARRNAVEAQVQAYNAALLAECTAAVNCTYDKGAVYNYQFTTSDISTRDYFHPSLTGQGHLAGVTWTASQWAS
ncbi:SGNH/GDSL hydrolase family protein [Microbacterium candidum]|uniref:SGNH/GDSL hydrolase family protein n=1 Tax=Microbacterium candidum TaxID=3041922 RepID=A0ABT7MWV3_9MICO|nr:SGNH/GDSL hydrolase family protein [Microbacterium sp. ASV49]MDL9978914.1 SGNH/GDSL hydrolase family protein [Microbacterium sp. ASV49]